MSITDDDDPIVTVSFEQATYTLAENDDTTTEVKENEVTVKVVRSADPERRVQLNLFRSHQGGAPPRDYEFTPDCFCVYFDAGDTEESITITAVNDSVNDDGESLSLTFGAKPTRVSEGTTNEAVVSITDDDKPTSLTVNFGSATYTAAEGGNVTLSDDPEMDVTIPITKANQDGASDSDYSGVPANVTFNSGDTEKEFTFTAAQDTVDDDNESVKLTFGTLPTIATAGTTDETVVSSTDDDDPSVTVSFGAATYTVAEGSSVTVRVQLNADPERTVTIPITKTNEGGASDSDHSGIPASVTFDAGDTEKTFSVTATDDTQDDDGESVKLTFGTLPTRVTKGTTDESVINITDDDKPTSLTVNFEQSSYTVAEGSNVIVKVTLNDDPERNVTIPLTKTNQDGASNRDYSGVPSSVTFASGDTEKTFTFTATSDTQDDDDENVKIEFGTLPTTPVNVSAGSTDETVVNITDDDVPAVTVSYQNSTRTVREGNSVTVSRAQCRPGAHRHHPHWQDQPGRGIRLRLLGRAGKRGLQLRRHQQDLQRVGHPGYGGRR